MSKLWTTGVLTAALTAMVAGCSSSPTTPQSPVQTSQADRHVQAVEDVTSFDQVMANIPQSISKQDADRLLVSIDPAQVQAQQGYSVQAVRRTARMGYGVGTGRLAAGTRFGRTYAFNRFGNVNRFRFYRYGNYAVPYGLYNNAYVPYGYGLGYGAYGDGLGCGGCGGYGGYGVPYLYNYGAGYSPYYAPYPLSGNALYPYAVVGYGHPFAAYGNGWRPWVYFNTPRSYWGW